MAAYLAERLGAVEVESTDPSVSVDKKAGRTTVSSSTRIREVPNATPNEISNLEIGEIILKLADFSPARMQLPCFDFPATGGTAKDNLVVLPPGESSPGDSFEDVMRKIRKPEEEGEVRAPKKSARGAARAGRDERKFEC